MLLLPDVASLGIAASIITSVFHLLVQQADTGEEMELDFKPKASLYYG